MMLYGREGWVFGIIGALVVALIIYAVHDEQYRGPTVGEVTAKEYDDEDWIMVVKILTRDPESWTLTIDDGYTSDWLEVSAPVWFSVEVGQWFNVDTQEVVPR